jgi:hypothetical protein
MWRWIIRVWVSLVLFWFLLFTHGLAFVAVARLIARTGVPFFVQWPHGHIVLTLFLLGIASGQCQLGSNFTGERWFRSKDGQTYEGFKLEELKPWTWLLVSPIFLLGGFGWFWEQSNSGVFANISFANFYQSFLMPNCSNTPLRAYQFNPSCTMQFLFVGIWMASVGYSLAPTVRRFGKRFLRRPRNATGTTIQMEKGFESSMKEKADL